MGQANRDYHKRCKEKETHTIQVSEEDQAMLKVKSRHDNLST